MGCGANTLLGYKQKGFRMNRLLSVAVVLGACWRTGLVTGQTTFPQYQTPYQAGELLVCFEPKADGSFRSAEERNSLLATRNAGMVRRAWALVPGLALVELPGGVSIESALAKLKGVPGIRYACPNYVVRVASTFPNEPNFVLLWGMHNTGQVHPTEGGGTAAGQPDADIDAPEGWDIATDATDIVVAVIDTGVDYTHPDLAGNMWVNEAELHGEAGVDDDGNGYVDDIYGYDFCTWDHARDSDPLDDRYHGTHCAGTIGAVGDNSKGVVGVCWRVRLMALKFLNYNGEGLIADAIDAIEYAVQNGAKVLSNSWGLYVYVVPLRDAIIAAQQAGVLFVAAAGNEGEDNDNPSWRVNYTPAYPASYDCENIIAVLATDHNDVRAVQPNWYSNYGETAVDLGAPGQDIVSTFPTYQTPVMQYRGFSTCTV